MVEVFVLLLAGILLGYLLRNKKKVLRINGKLTSVSIFMLLFLLGVSLGGDSELLAKLPNIGLHALMLSLMAISGSVALAFLLYHSYFKRKIDTDEE